MYGWLSSILTRECVLHLELRFIIFSWKMQEIYIIYYVAISVWIKVLHKFSKLITSVKVFDTGFAGLNQAFSIRVLTVFPWCGIEMKITPVIGNGLKFGIMYFLSYGNKQYLHGNHIPPPQTKQIENKKKKLISMPY